MCPHAEGKKQVYNKTEKEINETKNTCDYQTANNIDNEIYAFKYI